MDTVERANPVCWAISDRWHEQVVQVEWLRHDVRDPARTEVGFVVADGRADEEHGRRSGDRLGVQPVEDLEAAQTRHHDVEDEKVRPLPAHRVEHVTAVRHDNRLVTGLVVDGVSQEESDRLVILRDHDHASSRAGTRVGHALARIAERP